MSRATRTKAPLPKLPRALHREVVAALKRLDKSMALHEVADEWLELLKLYREWASLRDFKAAFLLGMDWPERERVPLLPSQFADRPATWQELVPALQMLDDALRRRRAFDPADYLSAATESAAQARRSSGPRGKRAGGPNDVRWPTADARNNEIGNWLQAQGYATSDAKSSLKRRAAKHFCVNLRYVEAAAAAAGLTRKSTTTTARTRRFK